MKKLVFIVCAILLTSVVNAQTKQVKGIVTGASDGIGIPGVSVSIKGTTQGTSTDFNGNYALNVKSTDVLVFSFVGMISQEVTVGDKSKIDVVLEEESIGVEEVVVMGYITRKKNELTGASVQVSSDALAEIPAVSVDQALQGKVAGVSITATSGTPGSVQNIRIRGVSSISAGNEPLYVIDGVPMVNDDMSGYGDYSSTLSSLASLNADNIESVTVLKDASATAAYGARGSNGVIVINTKAGKAGKTSFNFNGSYGFSNHAISMPKVLTNADYNELFSDFDMTLADFIESEGYDSSYAQTDTDWEELGSREDAIIQNYNLSARGGNEKDNFYASIGYSNNEGNVINADFERFTAQLNVSRKFSDKVKFESRNSGSTLTQMGFLEQSAYYSNPIASVYFMPSYYPSHNSDGTLYTDFPPGSNYNPLYVSKHSFEKNILNRIISKNTLSFNLPIEGLSFKSTYSIDYMLGEFTKYNDPNYGDAANTSGSLLRSKRTNFNWVVQNTLNYKFDLNNIHRFDFSFIQEYQKNKYDYLDAYGTGFPADGLETLDSAGANYDAGGSFEDWMIASYLALINYSYDGRFFFDGTYRREGSSRFAEKERWGNFWSVGGAWNVKNESFMADEDLFSTLRLRASYGVNGSHGVDPNSYQALLSYDVNYDNNGGSYPSQYGNDYLTWEKNEIFDVGIEFGMLEDRITANIGWYKRKTSDLLLDVPLSLTTGHSDQTQNVGEMENKGWEFEFNFNVINKQDFKWSVGGSLALVENEVTKIAQDAEGNDLNIETSTRIVEVGEPVYHWNMRTWAGVDPENGDPLWLLDEETGETTNVYNSAPKFDQEASALPTYTGSVNTHFEFKGVFVDANLYFSGGNKIYDSWARYIYSPYFWYDGSTGSRKLLDRWQQPGDITNVPRVGSDPILDLAANTSSRFLYDGDFVRLKNLTLGYNFPKELCQKYGLDGLSVYVKGTNLYTWVKDDELEWDPELAADGFIGLTAPVTKSIIFGLNLKF